MFVLSDNGLYQNNTDKKRVSKALLNKLRQPRSQAFRSTLLELAGAKTLVAAGHVSPGFRVVNLNLLMGGVVRKWFVANYLRYQNI